MSDDSTLSSIFYDGLAGSPLHRICKDSEGMGGWAIDEGLQGGDFVLHVSLRLCASIPKGMYRGP